MNTESPRGIDREQAVDPNEVMNLLRTGLHRRGHPTRREAWLRKRLDLSMPKLRAMERVYWRTKTAEWRVYGVVDEVTVQTGPRESRRFLVLGVFVQNPHFPATKTSVTRNQLGDLPLASSLPGQAGEVAVSVAIRAARQRRRSELVSLWLFDVDRLLQFPEVIRLLKGASPLHSDLALSAWWARLSRLKGFVDASRRATGRPSTVPQLPRSATRITSDVRVRHEGAFARVLALAKSGVVATDAELADAALDWAVVLYNIHLTRNAARRRPSREYRKQLRSWRLPSIIAAAIEKVAEPQKLRREDYGKLADLNGPFVRMMSQASPGFYGGFVKLTNQSGLKVVPVQVVTNQRVLESLITRRMWSLELHGLDLDDKAARQLVRETIQLVERESPRASAETERGFLEAAFGDMALSKKLCFFETALGTPALRRRLTPKEQRGDRVLAKHVGNVMMRFAFAEPGQRGPVSWGITDFYVKALSYLAYEVMKADPRFWKEAKVEWRRSRRRKDSRPHWPGNYRLCAFADFLWRNGRNILASPYKFDRRTQCRTPIKTEGLQATFCDRTACPTKLSRWTRRLRKVGLLSY